MSYSKGKHETPEEFAKRIGVPVIPKRAKPIERKTIDIIAVCGECGHGIRKQEYFACNNADCPLHGNTSMAQEVTQPDKRKYPQSWPFPGYDTRL